MRHPGAPLDERPGGCGLLRIVLRQQPNEDVGVNASHVAA